MNILVSSCLLGVKCRYDGSCFVCDKVLKLQESHNLVPVCPEVCGGLPTPREPCEIFENRVVSKSGKDFTQNFVNGANEALRLAKSFDCKYAILKERSPSCGSCKIYDGTFGGNIINGKGVTAKLLLENSIQIFSENQIDELMLKIK